MSDVTPGSQTSEQNTLKKVALWSRIICGMVVAAGTSLLASGQIPEGSQAEVWIGMVITVLGALAGEFAQGIAYTKSRTAVKVAQATSAALAEASKPQDPPKP